MNLFKNIGVIIFEIARIYSFIFSFLYYKINRMTNPDGRKENGYIMNKQRTARTNANRGFFLELSINTCIFLQKIYYYFAPKGASLSIHHLPTVFANRRLCIFCPFHGQ